MKINVFRAILMAVLAALVGYGCYEISDTDPRRIITAVAVGLVTFVTSSAASAVDYLDGRIGVSIKLVSGIFVAIGIVMNVIFAFFEYNIPLFVICNGVLLVLYLLIAQGLYKSEQQ